MTASYPTAQRGLHGLAELVLAGPRSVAGGSMRLRADHDGIVTWDDPPRPDSLRGTQLRTKVPDFGGVRTYPCAAGGLYHPKKSPETFGCR
jgi:hypothetical protein